MVSQGRLIVYSLNAFTFCLNASMKITYYLTITGKPPIVKVKPRYLPLPGFNGDTVILPKMSLLSLHLAAFVIEL